MNGRNILADFVVQLAGQVLAGIFFGVDQLFGERPPRLKFGLQSAAIVIEISCQLLLTTDGDPQTNPEQRLGGEENLQLHQIGKTDANLTRNGDHHAAQQSRQYAALPAKLPRHDDVWQKNDDQQQALKGGGEHHLRADPDDKKQAAPDDKRGA
ncbi:hypothetical protein D3C78_567420 [compost metagenome]